VTVWQGLLAPAGTDAAIIERLHSSLRNALALPELTARLDSLGVQAVGGSPEAFGSFVVAEINRWSKVVRRSGARAD
jgi:tripartite-type tricarboxylate transporter receptor subunit TctC